MSQKKKIFCKGLWFNRKPLPYEMKEGIERDQWQGVLSKGQEKWVKQGALKYFALENSKLQLNGRWF